MTNEIPEFYKSYRIIDGKPKWIVVDKAGYIINIYPSKEELEHIEKETQIPYSRGNKKEIKRLWTKEEIYNIIRQTYDEIGYIPTVGEFESDPKHPSKNTIWNICGNWNCAIECAGLVREDRYKISVSLDKQNFFYVISDNCRLIRYPTKEDLNGAIPVSYNPTNICPLCIKELEIIKTSEIIDSSILYPGNVLHTKDEKGNKRWICKRHGYMYHYNRSDSTHNLIRSMRGVRTGMLDQNCSTAKGNNGQKLLCEWKGYIDLNKKLDNYNTRIDCLDEKTGEYYQAKIAYYNPIDRSWRQDFMYLQDSISLGFRFKSLFLFCISKDEVVERSYEIPEKEVIYRSSIAIYRNTSRSTWYERYRVTGEDALKLNKIWSYIIGSIQPAHK